MSPKRAVGCTGGSRHVNGVGGIPFLGNKKQSGFLGFLVSQFLGFKVSRFQSFLVSKLRGFKVAWFLGFDVLMFPYYQNSISCFLEDIDPVSKIFKNLLDGYS